MKLIDIIIFLIPLISGYTMSLICPMKKESGSNIPARPPAWVFGVVWPILYILMGLSWVLLRKEKNKTIVDILFFLLIITLNSWLFSYSCLKKKKIALYSSYITCFCFSNMGLFYWDNIYVLFDSISCLVNIRLFA